MTDSETLAEEQTADEMVGAATRAFFGICFGPSCRLRFVDHVWRVGYRQRRERASYAVKSGKERSAFGGRNCQRDPYQGRRSRKG